MGFNLAFKGLKAARYPKTTEAASSSNWKKP
jgi:hypothetical protein